MGFTPRMPNLLASGQKPACRGRTLAALAKAKRERTVAGIANFMIDWEFEGKERWVYSTV